MTLSRNFATAPATCPDFVTAGRGPELNRGVAARQPLGIPHQFGDRAGDRAGDQNRDRDSHSEPDRQQKPLHQEQSVGPMRGNGGTLRQHRLLVGLESSRSGAVGGFPAIEQIENFRRARRSLGSEKKHRHVPLRRLADLENPLRHRRKRLRGLGHHLIGLLLRGGQQALLRPDGRQRGLEVPERRFEFFAVAGFARRHIEPA
jgi:hypothetical protein